MFGVDNLVFAGNVGNIISSHTHQKNEPVCNFLLYCEKKTATTVARINAYGRLASFVQSKINQGDYVIVQGEHMNRSIKNSEFESLEIRMTQKPIFFKNKKDFDTHLREYEKFNQGDNYGNQH